jgi:Copper binding proteins, plastocyanin/azurin family
MYRQVTAGALLLGALLAAVPLATSTASAVPRAAAQVLTWTAGDDITGYRSVPTQAQAGAATIVLENSAATGNTTGMPHTLTFDTTTDGYNHDVTVNILASPFDTSGGRHEVPVTLTAGRYRYFCAMPGHDQMVGELVVTGDGGGGDTTPPTVTADVAGTRDAAGNYVGTATATITASDSQSGVATVEYSLDGAAFATYTAPIVVTAVGAHMLHFRATDVAGNVSAEQMAAFTVVTPPVPDTTPPTTAATVTGQRDGNGAYVGSATVTVTATDPGSGVRSVEYSLDGAAFATYTTPVVVAAIGTHTVRYRATDVAGNRSAEKTVTFTVVRAGSDACPDSDRRRTVVIRGDDTGVANVDTGNGCTINDLIAEQATYPDHASFVRHVREVTDRLVTGGTLTLRQQGAIVRTAARSDVGG